MFDNSKSVPSDVREPEASPAPAWASAKRTTRDWHRERSDTFGWAAAIVRRVRRPRARSER